VHVYKNEKMCMLIVNCKLYNMCLDMVDLTRLHIKPINSKHDSKNKDNL
jgi:hypothetical protein